MSRPVTLSQPSPEHVAGESGVRVIQKVCIPRYWRMSDEEAGECVIERFGVVPREVRLSEHYQEFLVIDPEHFARLETRVNPIDVKIVYGTY